MLRGPCRPCRPCRDHSAQSPGKDTIDTIFIAINKSAPHHEIGGPQSKMINSVSHYHHQHHRRHRPHLHRRQPPGFHNGEAVSATPTDALNDIWRIGGLSAGRRVRGLPGYPAPIPARTEPESGLVDFPGPGGPQQPAAGPQLLRGRSSVKSFHISRND